MTKIHPATHTTLNYKLSRDFVLNIINQSNRHSYFVLDTPFHRNTVDSVPFDQINYFENLTKIYSSAFDDICSGKTKLVFMFSDWWHTVNRWEKDQQINGNLMSLDLYSRCYNMCKENNILKNSVFVVPSSLEGVEQYEDWPIVSFNEPFNRYFEFFKDIQITNNSGFKKHFLWLNRRTRQHRVYALHQAYQLGLFDNCMYSFFDYSETKIAESYYKDNLSKYLPPEKINFDFLKLNKRLDIDYDEVTDTQYLPELLNLNEFSKQTYLHIVGEYNCSDTKVFLTEKASRPIVMGKPFVLFGDRGSLKELHNLGFKTFGDFWDESYDRLRSIDQRIDGMLEVLNHIRTTVDLTQEYNNQMLDILNYNRQLYYTEYYTSQIKNLQEALK